MVDGQNGAPVPAVGEVLSAASANDREGSVRSSSTASNTDVPFNKNQPLAKSNSVLSHKSIPFTGAYPIGHLKVVQAAEPISEGRETSGGENSTAASDNVGTTGGGTRNSGNIAGGSQISTRPPPKGDVFVLLSIPFESQVGCDIMALTVKKTAATETTGGSDGGNSALLGFRDLPPGAHFVWLSAPGAMSRQGYWFVTQPEPYSAVRVKQWDRFNEVLGECASQYEARSLTEDITAVYPRLLSYNSAGHSTAVSSGQRAATSASPRQPYLGLPQRDSETVVPEAGIWAGLTSCISEPVLGRITGHKPPATTGIKEQAVAEVAAATPDATTAATHTEWMVSTTDTAKGEMAMPRATSQLWAGYAEFTFLFAKDDLDPYQLIASRDKTKSGDSGQTALPSSSALQHNSPDKSANNTGSSDTTERIVALLDQSSPASDNSGGRLGDSDLIGELQFAFLTGTLLSNLSCLEQWWHLVLKIFLRARELVSRRPALCRSFIQTLHCQLLYLERHVSGGFLGHTSASTGANATTTADTDADAGGTGIFEAKPQGAARLQVSLTDFKRHLNEILLGLGKAASPEEAAVGEAFASLEASLWKYGWDLRSDYVAGGAGNSGTDGGYENDDNRGGRFGDPADNDDADGEMDYYEEAISRTTRPGQDSRRKHHTGLSDTDSDSDQPVLVDLDEDGREVGLLSWD